MNNIFEGKSDQEIINMCEKLFGVPEKGEYGYRFPNTLLYDINFISLASRIFDIKEGVKYSVPDEKTIREFGLDLNAPDTLSSLAYKALKSEAETILNYPLTRSYVDPIIPVEEIARRLEILKMFYGMEKVNSYANTALPIFYFINSAEDIDKLDPDKISSGLEKDLPQFINFVNALEIVGIDKEKIRVNGKTIQEVLDMLAQKVGKYIKPTNGQVYETSSDNNIVGIEKLEVTTEEKTEEDLIAEMINNQQKISELVSKNETLMKQLQLMKLEQKDPSKKI